MNEKNPWSSPPLKSQKGTTEGKYVAGPVLTRAQAQKSDKIHPLKVKKLCQM